ncbi:hypothetical protein DINM_004924 [Dirofilaria immitis]|nr:hypothetical protein [Dirofilaria immitis]
MGDCGKWKSLDSPLSPWCCMAVVSRVLCLPVPMTLACFSAQRDVISLCCEYWTANYSKHFKPVSDSPFRIMFCASRRKFIKQYSCTLPTAAEIIHFPVPPISEPTLSCSPSMATMQYHDVHVRMLEQGSMVCSSGNKPIGMESRNIYSKIGEIITPDAAKLILLKISGILFEHPSSSQMQTSLNNTSKNALNVERMSPASVDSGFDSSFPSSPDCSLDSSVSISGADTTKCYKDSNFKRRHQTAASLNAMLQCPLSICQPSCSTLSSPTNHTSSDISTFSTKSLINIDSKTNEHFCLDACLLKKTVSLTLLSSSLQLEVDIPFNQDSGVPSIARLDKSAKSLARYSTIPSFSGNASSEVNEVKSRVRCHWKSCAEQFACDNDLYDHVVKAHLELLRSSVYLEGKSNSKNGGGGSQSQTIGRLKI